MNIKCAIFDFDGTLFDSMHIWDNVAKSYLRSLKIEPKPSLNEDVKTMSLYQSACFLKREYDLALCVEDIILGINNMVERFYLYEVLPKSGVAQFLDELKTAGVSMCIATATDRYLIESALKRCELKEYFDMIFTCGEVGSGKDEPEIYRTAMEHFGARRSETLVFEDAMYAIKTAKADGFLVVGVADESEKQQDKVRGLSDCYIESFENTEDFWKFVSPGF